MKICRTLAVLAALILSAVTVASGQTNGRAWDPTGLQLTRQELQDLLAVLDETANSSEYSGTLRGHARDEAALIRQRLEEGDIRVGDRITLKVEALAPLATTLSTDYTVLAGLRIILPEIGEVPLAGVLRSELQSHITKHLSAFIKDPIVRAWSAVRIEISGAVGKPGFYMVPSDMILTEVLMQAGGPNNMAELDKVRIRRGKDVIWDGDRVREAMIEGRTLDQLSVRAGDEIDIPATGSGFSIRTVTMTLGSLMSVVFLYNRLQRAGVF